MTRSARPSPRLVIDHLEDRSVPAVTAVSLGNNLSVTSDAASDVITGQTSLVDGGGDMH